MKRKAKPTARPVERVIFSLHVDGTVMPGPGVDSTQAATTAFWASRKAAEEAVRIGRAAKATRAKRANAKAAHDAALPRVVALVKEGKLEKEIAPKLGISPRQVTRLKMLARQRGDLPPGRRRR